MSQYLNYAKYCFTQIWASLWKGRLHPRESHHFRPPTTEDCPRGDLLSKNIPSSHSQYHDCWWPGDIRNQWINCTIFICLPGPMQEEIKGNITWHYTDITMSPMASQISSLGSVYSTVYSGADQRKHESSASLAFVRRIHRGPVTRKMFPFDDVIMKRACYKTTECCVILCSMMHTDYLHLLNILFSK